VAVSVKGEMRGFASAFFGSPDHRGAFACRRRVYNRLPAVYRRKHAAQSDDPQFVGHSVAWPARRTMMSPPYLDTSGKRRNADDNNASLSGEIGGLAARLNSIDENYFRLPRSGESTVSAEEVALLATRMATASAAAQLVGGELADDRDARRGVFRGGQTTFSLTADSFPRLLSISYSTD